MCVIFGGVVEGIGWFEFNDIWDKLYTPPFMYLRCTGLPIWTLHTGLLLHRFELKVWVPMGIQKMICTKNKIEL